MGYGSPLFNNTGCGIETLPSSGLTAGFNPGGLSNCNGDTKDIVEGTLGLLVQALQRAQGQTAVRSAVLVPDQDGLGRIRYQRARAAGR